MRLLLPMAYALLFVFSDDDFVANGKRSDPNDDNYTYRLMELEVEPGHEEYAYEPQKIPSNEHSDNAHEQNIVPREEPSSLDEESDNVEEPVPKRYKNIRRPVRNNKKLMNVEIPDDFQKEISEINIPNRLPRRIKKRRKKTKTTTPEPEDIKEVQDEDENNSQEEEEEVEEKKEKVHKFTIKKKRPFVNATKSSTLSPSPFKTIADMNKEAGRIQSTMFQKPKIKPLLSQENIEALNPNHYYEKNVRKGIKPRDVNFILRTRHSPRILIRRYKPLFGPYLGLNLVDHKHLRRPLKNRKKPCKRCKKKRKKNQFFHQHPALASDVENVHSHYTNPSCLEHSSAPQAGNTGNGIGMYPFYGSQPSSSVYYQYSPNNDYYQENVISPRAPSPSYLQMPYESHYPMETYTSVPFSTELPYTAKTEYVPAKEEVPGGYDVHEHENTEELAANHQQETDVNLEDENDALQYEDAEPENAAEEYEENEAEEEEESNPRWDSVFNFPNKKAKTSDR